MSLKILKAFQPSLECLFSLKKKATGVLLHLPQELSRDSLLQHAKTKVQLAESEPVPWVQGSQTCQSEGVQTYSQRQGRDSPLPLPER